MNLQELATPLIMEFIGTFSLVFIGGFSVLAGNLQSTVIVPALTHGGILGVMIYIGAKKSGAHYNPAVTLALMSTSHIAPVLGGLYVAAQLSASLAAGALILLIKPHTYEDDPTILGFPHLDSSTSKFSGFMMEAIGTFYLMLSIYVAAIERKESPAVCGFVIGATLTLCIFAFGISTGGAFNPARTLGPAILSGHVFSRGQWIYMMGPKAGATLAGLVARFFILPGTNSEDEASKVEHGAFKLDDSTEIKDNGI